MKNRFSLTVSAILLSGLCACAPDLSEYALENRAEYWQRSNASSSIYLQGAKAQQMLNRDISRCVTEVRELERLGAIRTAIPAENPYETRTPQADLEDWDTPERDGALRAEHLPFADFETCMIDKGWERTRYVPYDVSENAKKVYRKNILGEKYRTIYNERGERIDNSQQYGELNE